MGKSLFGLLLFLCAIALVSCGPEKSARERELDQLQKTVSQNKTMNDEIAGWYRGELTLTDGTKRKACMYVYSTNFSQDLPSRGSTINIPTLIGYIFIAGNPQSYSFERSDYNSDTRLLHLRGDNNTFFELSVFSNKLVGQFYTTNLFSDVDVTRENRKACLAGIR